MVGPYLVAFLLFKLEKTWERTKKVYNYEKFLKFFGAFKTIPKEDIKPLVESLIGTLPKENVDVVSFKIVECLSCAKPPQENVAKIDQSTLKTF